MKKTFLLIASILCFTSHAQVVSSVDFFVLNEGMEASYLELEKIWMEFHKKNIEDGKMTRWTMLKVDATNGGPKDAANYITVNTYPSMEDYEAIWDNFSLDAFTKLVKKRLRGKMSSRTINKILKASIKKSHRSYMITPLDGTAQAVPLQKGDVILLDAMVEQSEDYEKYESSFAKPVMQYNVDNGNLKLWGFTKIIDRNEAAVKEPTHFTWRIPVAGKEFDWGSEKLFAMFGNQFVYNKMWESIGKSRTVAGRGTLKIVEIIQ